MLRALEMAPVLQSANAATQAANGRKTRLRIFASFGAASKRFFARPMTWTGKDAAYLRPVPMAMPPSLAFFGATVASAPTARKTSSKDVIVRP